MAEQQKSLRGAFGMFVKSVRGHVVGRYGTRSDIGYERRGGKLVQTSEIVALTKRDVGRYGLMYQRHIEAGELVQCTEDDFLKQVAAAEKAEEKGRVERKKAREKAAEEAAEKAAEEAKKRAEKAAEAASRGEKEPVTGEGEGDKGNG